MANIVCSLVVLLFFAQRGRLQDGCGQADDCTSGFMSLERIHAVMEDLSSHDNLVTDYNDRNTQAIIPGTSFACSGSIVSWIFGAVWVGNTASFTELQIWRSSGDGSYTKVGSTTINVTEESATRLYRYPLNPPLPFQAGDILGYYQPRRSRSQLQLMLEYVGSDAHPLYYQYEDSAAIEFTVAGSRMDGGYHVLIAVETDSPGCECGFMSVERMRILLGLDTVGDVATTERRQQITPDMKFTCDGMITKWIIGAGWRNNDVNLYPELQVWRNSGNDIYQKINGTFITVQTRSEDWIYEYSNFPPIPFQSGDVLGVFIPRDSRSKLRLVSEGGHGPTNYYITTESVSAYENIDLQHNTPRVLSSVYHALVTVGIITKHFESSTMTTTKDISTPTQHQSLHTSDGPQTSILIKPSVVPPLPDINGDASPDLGSFIQSSVGVGVGGGVGAAVVVLLVVTVSGVRLFVVWRRRNTSKLVLQPSAPANGGVGQLDNTSNILGTRLLETPVYESEAGTGNSNPAIHCSKLSLQQNGIYDPPSTEYEFIVPRKETMQLDNPLYSVTGPVTFTESSLHESSEYGASSATTECYYVLTTAQHGMKMEQEDHEYPYSICSSDGLQDLFEETDIYWAPASTIIDLYKQLSYHKYREISRQHIEIIGSLGSGQFGVVSKGRWQAAVEGPVDVAIKTLRPSANETDRVKFLQEAAINGQFRHPNIVQLHGVVTVGEPIMIILEYMPNGNLRDFLRSLKARRSDPTEQGDLSQLCLSFSRHVASGMSYLAGKAFVHRDLAARNILISESRVCKVADFGMARDLDEGAYYMSQGGKIPVKWTAPEALHYMKYSTASDVWSFGCLMYEIWSLGHKPFEDYTNSQVLSLVNEDYRLAPPPGCPRHIYAMMINCWHPEKSSRPSFHSLCQALGGEPATLLQWREEDSQCHPQASCLGAPLDAGKHLYTELQETYFNSSLF